MNSVVDAAILVATASVARNYNTNSRPAAILVSLAYFLAEISVAAFMITSATATG
jgi:hypothetical protein